MLSKCPNCGAVGKLSIKKFIFSFISAFLVFIALCSAGSFFVFLDLNMSNPANWETVGRLWAFIGGVIFASAWAVRDENWVNANG